MPDRRDARDPRGLGGAWRHHQNHDETRRPPGLERWVDRIWSVRWSYGEHPFAQKIVPHPQVHLTVASDAPATVQGVRTTHQVRTLTGAGEVVGVAFRPGVFRQLLGRPVATLTDRALPAQEVFPGLPADRPDGDDLATHLRASLPEPDPAGQDAAAIVERVIATPGTRRVDDLAGDVGVSVRSLQRLFAEHVGVGPKQVIRRYRLHEVTERLAAGEDVDWAALAAELGFADQAHLSRDFAALFGEPPTAYEARY